MAYRCIYVRIESDTTEQLHTEQHSYFKKRLDETCILSRVKQITSPGWMHEKVLGPGALGRPRGNRVEREVGGGIGMGNTCISKADSCQCMTKTTTIL